MLYLDIPKACSNKGIGDARKFLVNIGFNHSAVTRMLNNSFESLRLPAIEKICLHLNCSPNELLSWQPSEGDKSLNNHALDKLKPIADKDSIVGKLKQLPPEKLDKLREFLGDLENQ